jgi:hypothetical protein
MNIKSLTKFIIIAMVSFLLNSCSAKKSITAPVKVDFNLIPKSDTQKPLTTNVDFVFESDGLALDIKGNGKIDIYEKYLKVRIQENNIKINPKCKIEDFTMLHITTGIGKKKDPFSGSWQLKNRAITKTINKKFDSKTDYTNIGSIEFLIPYSDKAYLKDAWIVIEIKSLSGGYVYAHSEGRMQDFGFQPEEKTLIDYSKFTEDELYEKQEALSLELNHLIFKNYITYAETKKPNFPVKEMKTSEIDSLWKNFPELIYYNTRYKLSNEDWYKFKVDNSPDYKENLRLYHKKEITLDEYYKRHRGMVLRLKEKYPEEHERLAGNAVAHSKDLWIATLKYLLEDYKNKEKKYPLTWITEEQLSFLKNTRLCKRINEELIAIEDEIIKRI